MFSTHSPASLIIYCQDWSEREMQRRGVAPRRNLKLSLSQPSKPKALRLTIGSSTPTPTVVGGTIDSESLRRQKEEMGQALSRAQRAGSKTYQANGSTPGPSSATASFRRSISVITDQQDTIMADTNGTSTPHLSDTAAKVSQTPAPVHLPTPLQELDPTQSTAPVLTNGVHHHEKSTSPAGRRESLQSDNPVERRYREPGKGISDFLHTLLSLLLTFLPDETTALLQSVTFKTNPNIPSDPKWKLTRHASPLRTQTSAFISLPANYNFIRIIPSLNTAEISLRRRHKIFVIHNGTVYREPNSPQPGAYDVKLNPGENSLNVEVLADLKDGEKKPYIPPQMQFDFEKCGLIVNLGGLGG